MGVSSSSAIPAAQAGPSLDRAAARALRDGASQQHDASVAFLTVQGSRHSGRSTGYVNTVLSVRVGAAVGSCAVEPGELEDGHVREIVGGNVAELLEHPHPAVRVATLDAFLADRAPHADDPRARTARVPGGSSLDKSTARARAVVDLVPDAGPVAVIGVVNSLLVQLRERGLDYLPCDLKGGTTEWGEQVLTDHEDAIAEAGCVLASGMVLGNGSFDRIAQLCAERGIPLVMFAQTGAAVLREMLGAEVHALSAEPYPFFWLSGEATDIHCYPGAGE